eukprot:RCo024797
MPRLSLSKAEKLFMEEGVRENVRGDGRGRLEFRSFDLETSVIPLANGSARLALGLSEVLVGVKCSIGDPAPEKPDWGRLEVVVNSSASCSWELEAGDRSTQDLLWTQHLSRVLSGENVLPWATLKISKTKCWVINVEVMVLESGGNLLDAISIAVRAALLDTRVPVITVTESGHKSRADQIEVRDDPRHSTPLPACGVPLLLTVLSVAGYLVADPTLE